MAHNRDLSQFANTIGYNGGSIGIGTDNPTAKLEVATSVDGEATLATFKNTSGGGTNETVDIKLGLENTVASNVILRAGKEANHGSGGATDNFFSIHTTLDNTSAERFRIDSAGLITVGPSGSSGITLNPNGNLTAEGKVLGQSVDTTVAALRAVPAQGSSRSDWALASEIIRTTSGSATNLAAYWNISSNSNNNYAKTALALSLKHTYGSGAVDLNQFKFNSSGTFSATNSIGIGTDSPATDFHLHSSSSGSNSEILLTNGDTGLSATDGFKIALNTGAGGEIWNYENDYIRFGTNNTERLRITADGQSTFDKGAPGSANQVIARFQAESSRRLDIVWHDSGSLLGFDLPGSHSYIFKCSGSEKLRITSGGNVGVNDNDPSSLLSISQTNGNAKLQIKRANSASNTDDYGSILWRSAGGTAVGAINVARETGEDNGYMFFQTTSGGTMAERLRITSDGTIRRGNSNGTDGAQPVELFFQKRGTQIGKRIHQGSGGSSTTHNILNIDSWQSTNSHLFAYVTVYYVSPVSNYGGKMEAYANAVNSGGNVSGGQGTFVVADAGRWGNPGTMSLSWSGSTLRLTTFAAAYIDYSVDITYIAYDGAVVSFYGN